jgi:hypothetical protein
VDLGPILLAIVSLALGVVITGWYTEYAKRPLLRIDGSGSSRSGSVNRFHLTVSNPPTFMGIDLGGTMVLGRRLHAGFRRGLTVDRNPAKHCHAHLYRKPSGDHITGLYWWSGGRFESAITIQGGDSASVALFARNAFEPPKYFVPQPDPAAPQGIREPEGYLKFTGEGDFEVRVTYSNGATVSVDIRVRLDYQGNLQVEQRHKSGGGGSSIFL